MQLYTYVYGRIKHMNTESWKVQTFNELSSSFYGEEVHDSFRLVERFVKYTTFLNTEQILHTQTFQIPRVNVPEKK